MTKKTRRMRDLLAGSDNSSSTTNQSEQRKGIKSDSINGSKEEDNRSRGCSTVS